MTYLGRAVSSGQILHDTGDEGHYSYGTYEGDVVGTLKDATVSGIGGFQLSGTPASGDHFYFDGTNWTFQQGMSVAHNLLSTTHTDTTPHTPVRGDIIVGSGGNTWNALALGAAEFVLYSDGTDALYTRLGQNTPFELGTAALPAVTFTGDTDTGWSAASPDTMVGSASGTAITTIESAGNGQIVTNDAGMVYRTRTVAGGAQAMFNDDYIILVTAAPGTVTLPGGPTAGQVVIIKDRDGNASGGSRITIDGNGNTIDGNSSVQIRNSYGSFTLLYNGSTWNVI